MWGLGGEMEGVRESGYKVMAKKGGKWVGWGGDKGRVQGMFYLYF